MKQHVDTVNTSTIAALYTIITAAIVTGVLGVALIIALPSEQPLTQVLSLNASLVSFFTGVGLYAAIRGHQVLRVACGGLVFLAATYSVLTSTGVLSDVYSVGSLTLRASLYWPLTLIVALFGLCLMLGMSVGKRKLLWRFGGYVAVAFGLFYIVLSWYNGAYNWLGPHPMVVSISVLFLTMFGIALLIGSYQSAAVESLPRPASFAVMVVSVSIVCAMWFALASSEVRRIEGQVINAMHEAVQKREAVSLENVNLIQRLATRWQHVPEENRLEFSKLDVQHYQRDLPQLLSILVTDTENELVFEDYKTTASSYYWMLGTPDVTDAFTASQTSPVVLIPHESIRASERAVILVRLPLFARDERSDDDFQVGLENQHYGYVVAIFDFASLVNPIMSMNEKLLHTYASLSGNYMLRSDGEEAVVANISMRPATSLYHYSIPMQIPYVKGAELHGFHVGKVELRKAANLYAVVITGGLLLCAFLVISLERGQILRTQRRQLQLQATHDSLTGLVNRVVIEERLQQFCEQCIRSKQEIAVLFIDLDGFKPVNDSLGLQVGDKLLRETAARLQRCMRNNTLVGRFGGDEFIVLIPELDKKQPITDLVSEILSAIAQPYHIEQYRLYLTASIGITTTIQSPIDAKQLIQHADMAMYQAKRQGRNHYQFYTAEISERFHSSVTLRNELQHVLEQGALKLFYQPLVRCGDRKIVGVEALLRWQREDGSYVSPAEFIPLAEDTGQIIPISAWVVQQACEDGIRLQEYGDLSVAVNLSAVQFNRANFVESLNHTLNLTGFSAQKLHLELTESVLMEDSKRAIRLLESLHNKNFHISIDDFGTGFSSLSYLKRMPVNILKIDRAFIKDVTTDVHDAAIAKSIIQMATQLSIEVTAEGVETAEQVKFVEESGCHYMQGFYFAKPMPLAELMALLNERDSF
ncbi:MAG: EAL domain-containing protein [Idiomarina sp.]|nr:EAL domain-containing protein [Idiomarina sp.]